MRISLCVFGILACYGGLLSVGHATTQAHADTAVIESKPPEEAERLNQQAQALLDVDPVASRQMATQALKISEALGNKAVMAEAHRLIGFAYQRGGDLGKDMSHLQRGLELARESGATRVEADILRAIGVHHDYLLNPEDSINYYLEAKALAHKIDYKLSEANASNNIGFLLIKQGAAAEALQHLADALSLYDELGEREAQIFTLVNYGNALIDTGDYEKASGYLRRALEFSLQAKSHAGETIALVQIARLHKFEGNDQLAINTLKTLIKKHANKSFPEFIANGYIALGKIYEEHGNTTAAAETYAEGLETMKGKGTIVQQLVLMRRLSDILLSLGDATGSRDYLAHYIDLRNLAQPEDQQTSVMHLRQQLKIQDQERQLAAEKQNREIQVIEISRQEAANRNVVMALILSFLTIGGLSLWLIFRRRTIKTIRLQNEKLSSLSTEVMELSESKSRLIANTGHDLRTPLNGIIGITTLLESQELSVNQEGYVRALRASADTLKFLMDDILDISQLELGLISMDKNSINLCDHLDEVLSSFQHMASNKGVALTVDYAKDIPSIVTYPSERVAQVLSNLISNALKFTRQGSVVVSVESMENNSLRFKVTDTGSGISPQDQQAIFERFKQTDVGADKKYDGLGLGLAICREFTQLWGGTIGLESDLGLGSRFWFTVPIAPDATKTNASGPAVNTDKRAG